VRRLVSALVSSTKALILTGRDRTSKSLSLTSLASCVSISSRTWSSRIASVKGRDK
jgi:hypothetical protein